MLNFIYLFLFQQGHKFFALTEIISIICFFSALSADAKIYQIILLEYLIVIIYQYHEILKCVISNIKYCR